MTALVGGTGKVPLPSGAGADAEADAEADDEVRDALAAEVGRVPRVLLHVDLDAFFASVEQVLNPRLAGQPVIVGGQANDRSVVASASYEARACGVHVAMPIYRAYALCPRGHFLRGQFTHYARFSEQVFEVCRRFTPLVESAGIDEGYLDLMGTERVHFLGVGRPAHWPVQVAERLRDAIGGETGLKVSMGIGSNKLIAKVATQYAKPNGLCYVRPGYEAAFLAPLSLRAIPGIGQRTAEVLAEYNLHTVGQLVHVPEALLVRTFGQQAGEALYRKARGQGSTQIELEVLPKSISRETTFEQDTDDRQFIQAMLYYLVERACLKLRKLKLKARTVAVKLRYSDFVTPIRAKSLPAWTDQDDEVFCLVRELLDGLYTRRVLVRLVGVQLSHLSEHGRRQMHLWTEGRYQRRGRLYAASDRIRQRFGFSSLMVGPAIALSQRLSADPHGYLLRTPCLSQ